MTTSPSVTRSRQFYAPTQPGASAKPLTSNEYSLPFDASWEANLWGRVRNTVKANSLEAQATFTDLENVRLTVRAEATVDYFQIRALDVQRNLLDSEVLADRELLNLTQVQLDANLASGEDVALAETLLDITRAKGPLGLRRKKVSGPF